MPRLNFSGEGISEEAERMVVGLQRGNAGGEFIILHLFGLPRIQGKHPQN